MGNHQIKGFIKIKTLAWVLLALSMLVVMLIIILNWGVIANPSLL